jgi:Spy/CpxP family protein refolding chaperone
VAATAAAAAVVVLFSSFAAAAAAAGGLRCPTARMKCYPKAVSSAEGLSDTPTNDDDGGGGAMSINLEKEREEV